MYVNKVGTIPAMGTVRVNANRFYDSNGRMLNPDSSPVSKIEIVSGSNVVEYTGAGGGAVAACPLAEFFASPPTAHLYSHRPWVLSLKSLTRGRPIVRWLDLTGGLMRCRHCFQW